MTTKIIKNILTAATSTSKQATISKILNSNSYVVTDSSNRKFVVYSSSVWKVGDPVNIDTNRIVESSYTKKQTVFQV